MAFGHLFIFKRALFTPFQDLVFLRNLFLGTQLRLTSSVQRPGTTVSKEVRPEVLEQLFLNPTWSVESLLPPKMHPSDGPKITSQQLHHLLRLSALPLPENPEEEKKMLDTLSAQLHFVGEIQQVNTTGVKPLRVIRDETAAAEQEQTITLQTLREALTKEKAIGKHHKRIQRQTDPVDARNTEDLDVLGFAEKKVGKYLMVESQRPQE
ncbi:uncharacterized protein BDR25DRAFT_30891 [Lindgomyces ingoldianus]|uniref:Uncharacterized protein n=1 Tax=Lindgomyces ingoldianus TaxID=673940 RepID=A0ACB6QUI9_9PLEO|nr:uncharacterized protein BDR25DRAFT_30891 [Lindgomyces ingoldianus]KAF2470565.1 hypothetical protein BDR25DRAFT_30891 [Lindgomyces ingoldianus]